MHVDYMKELDQPGLRSAFPSTSELPTSPDKSSCDVDGACAGVDNKSRLDVDEPSADGDGKSGTDVVELFSDVDQLWADVDTDLGTFADAMPTELANRSAPTVAPSTRIEQERWRSSSWNFGRLNRADGSVFKYVDAKLSGINTPWLYFGNLFATFCWHNEDNFFFSINYHHQGQWPCSLTSQLPLKCHSSHCFGEVSGRLSAQSVHSQCTVGAQSVYSRCTVGAQSVHSQCTVGAQSVHSRCGSRCGSQCGSQCTVSVHSMCTQCTVSAYHMCMRIIRRPAQAVVRRARAACCTVRECRQGFP